LIERIYMKITEIVTGPDYAPQEPPQVLGEAYFELLSAHKELIELLESEYNTSQEERLLLLN
jgi:hypothetical protein